MKILRNIVSLIAAFHLVFATSGLPLVYMFCGENFCSWSVAKAPLTAEENPVSDEEDSCCANDCHSELHIAQLSVDALQAPSILRLNDIGSLLIAILPHSIQLLPALSNLAFETISFQKPPPRYVNRTILFRSLLI